MLSSRNKLRFDLRQAQETDSEELQEVLRHIQRHVYQLLQKQGGVAGAAGDGQDRC